MKTFFCGSWGRNYWIKVNFDPFWLGTALVGSKMMWSDVEDLSPLKNQGQNNLIKVIYKITNVLLGIDILYISKCKDNKKAKFDILTSCY